jgi:hypothetical protein
MRITTRSGLHTSFIGTGPQGAPGLVSIVSWWSFQRGAYVLTLQPRQSRRPMLRLSGTWWIGPVAYCPSIDAMLLRSMRNIRYSVCVCTFWYSTDQKFVSLRLLWWVSWCKIYIRSATFHCCTSLAGVVLTVFLCCNIYNGVVCFFT